MMQTRLAMSAVVLLLSAGVSVQTAVACSEEAAAGAVDRWTTVLAENNPDTIVALYSKDAVLWGTLSPTVRSDPAAPRSTRATIHFPSQRTAKQNRSPTATVSHT